MHRLVALSTQQWLEMNGGFDHWRSAALRSLVSKFPGPSQQKFADWTLYEALVPHAHCLFAHHYIITDDLLQTAQLQISLALYDLSRGRYSEAFELCSKSLETRQQLLSQNDPLLLESIQTLGESLLHRGELEDALAMIQRAAAGREKVLGIQNTATLESLSDLTIIALELGHLRRLYYEQGDMGAAEAAPSKVIAGEKKVLGSEGHDSQITLSNMSLVLRSGDHFSDAEGILRGILRVREDKSGLNHPASIFTLEMVEDLFQMEGDDQLANTTYVELQKRKAAKGNAKYIIDIRLPLGIKHRPTVSSVIDSRCESRSVLSSDKNNNKDNNYNYNNNDDDPFARNLLTQSTFALYPPLFRFSMLPLTRLTWTINYVA
ncbi:hypothetical protein F5Y03DRAFT_396710 [Xylaria venustula]|nr:hypothetical protein F5Y03DRAFT_396710 [Xylaria venustula]